MPTRFVHRLRSGISGLGLLAMSACGSTPAPTPEPVAPPPTEAPAPAPEPKPEPVVEAPNPDIAKLARWREGHPQVLELDTQLNDTRWFYAAKMLADRELFAAHFEATDFDLKRGSLLLVTQIAEGVGQPRYHYFTIDDTGWAPAPKYFVPASTVKLMASLSALWTLSKVGGDGDTPLSFKDIDGKFRGTAYKLYKDALLHSSNQNYNRLMGIAGFDETNTEYLTPERGFPVMAIQSRYGKKNKSYGIRVSPRIEYKVGDTEGELPRRKGEWRTEDCRGNCTTLFELQDIMRRVVLHDEIPADKRFPIARVDLDRIVALLLQARNRLQPSPNRAFGEEVEVYNEVGRIPGRVLLENSYLYAPASKKRIMLALSLRFPKDRDPKKDLQKLARAALDAALPAQPPGPGLQWDAGVELELEMRRDAQGVALIVSAATDEADSIELWEVNEALDTEALEVEGRRYAAVRRQLDERETLFVAIAKKGDQEVGYRSWRVKLPAASDG